jgi:hypothetical protein
VAKKSKLAPMKGRSKSVANLWPRGGGAGNVVYFGGDKGSRTPDLLNAITATPCVSAGLAVESVAGRAKAAESQQKAGHGLGFMGRAVVWLLAAAVLDVASRHFPGRCPQCQWPEACGQLRQAIKIIEWAEDELGRELRG